MVGGGRGCEKRRCRAPVGLRGGPGQEEAEQASGRGHIRSC